MLGEDTAKATFSQTTISIAISTNKVHPPTWYHGG